MPYLLPKEHWLAPTLDSMAGLGRHILYDGLPLAPG